MESPEFLIGRILGLLALAVVLIYFGLKLKMPVIVGFLATGVLVGPSGFELIENESQIESLSELGVVLLLFTIGLEFSVQSLLKMKKLVLAGGSLQMAFCILPAWGFAMLVFGFPWNTAFLIGCLTALSSTAIVLKLFQEKGEMDSAHGRGSLGVLIFQDLAVVPLVLLMPILAGKQGGDPVYMVGVKVLAILLVVAALAVWVVPWIMLHVAQTKSTELFMFTVALICLGTALATSKAGLSLALGAFLAGLIIAGSPYASQAISSVLPMRDIFTSLFFVSIGLRMDIRDLMAQPFMTVGLALLVMVVNAAAAAFAMRLIGVSFRVAVMIGFALCQVGEFAFVLASEGQRNGLLSHEAMKVFLNLAVITMAMTPLSLAIGRKISPWFADMSSQDQETKVPKLEGHAVVVGFGVAGQAVARACHRVGRKYLVIDMNPASVRAFRQLGEPLYFGDAASEHVLEHMGVKRAAILVVTIPDPTACQRIISAARNISPNIRILTRTRFLLSIAQLKELGADEVIAEEFEAAIAVFNSMLAFFGLPAAERRDQIALARKADPRSFRIAEVPKADSLEYPMRPESAKDGDDADEALARPPRSSRRSRDPDLDDDDDYGGYGALALAPSGEAGGASERAETSGGFAAGPGRSSPSGPASAAVPASPPSEPSRSSALPPGAPSRAPLADVGVPAGAGDEANDFSEPAPGLPGAPAPEGGTETGA
ncbi:MAG: cation:proton antiporter [Deltaproteobacteria bacterium]|jgi:CPA2 family monovalent cation:H+ antiporter-2|nr:cation:proton antiporter [Deltaproteobacteria bacterium]